MVYRLLLPSLPNGVARAVRFVEAIAREQNQPAELVDRLALAAGEAVANAVAHGNRLDPLRHVLVEWRAEGEGGWLTVEDEGAGLAPQHLDGAALPADPLSTGGRGLYIVKTLADEVRLDAGGRRVLLRFAPRADDLR